MGSRRNRLELRQEFVDRDRLWPDRRDRGELGIDRDDAVVAFALQPIARHIDDGDRIGAGLAELRDEGRSERLEGLAIDIASTGDVEAGLLQLIGDEARIVDGGRFGRRRGVGIGALPDHKGQSRLIGGRRRLRLRWECRQRRKGGNHQAVNPADHLGTPCPPARIMASLCLMP